MKVFVRVRPPDPNLESGLAHAQCLEVTSESTLTVYSKPEPKIFTFDHVADKDITQVRTHMCGSDCIAVYVHDIWGHVLFNVLLGSFRFTV